MSIPVPILVWFDGVVVVHSPWWCAKCRRTSLCGTWPQTFTSASSSLKSEQLVTLCATQLHRLALKFNTESICFSFFLMPPFMGGLESLWREIYSILFSSFLGPSWNQRCLESAFYLLSTISEGVCSHTYFYSSSSPPIARGQEWLAQQPTWAFWQLLPKQLLAGEL